MQKQRGIALIRTAFGGSAFPGDAFLQGSHQGYEPYETIAPFKGLDDWQHVDAALLDAYSEALSFFSEAGWRFFLPAYLIADLQERLHRADPQGLQAREIDVALAAFRLDRAANAPQQQVLHQHLADEAQYLAEG